jgi:hypothetical protein
MSLTTKFAAFTLGNRSPRRNCFDNDKSPTVPHQSQHSSAPLASPDYQREAEQIVKEEREQKERMPVYAVSDTILCTGSSFD